MAKLNLNDIQVGYNSASAQNANNKLTEDAVENTLSLDGTSPNVMQTELDMGSNKLINVADGVDDTDGVNIRQIKDVVAGTNNHSTLTNLDQDDHLQYLPVDGSRPMAGDLDIDGNLVVRAEINDYTISHSTPASVAGILTLDLTVGNSFAVSLTEDISNVILANPPASGIYAEIVIRMVQDVASSRTVTWPTSVKWPGGTAPVMSPAASAVDKVVLSTDDGGVSWLGNFSQDYS